MNRLALTVNYKLGDDYDDTLFNEVWPGFLKEMLGWLKDTKKLPDSRVI